MWIERSIAEKFSGALADINQLRKKTGVQASEIEKGGREREEMKKKISELQKKELENKDKENNKENK